MTNVLVGNSNRKNFLKIANIRLKKYCANLVFMVILENENLVFNLGNILLFARESLKTRKMNSIPLLVIAK